MSKINHYEALVATVEEGTLAKAAQRLNCSPSSVSKQLTLLESELKVNLLERSNRAVLPTEAGNQFYSRCKTILADMRRAEEEAAAYRDTYAGKIILSVSTALTRSSLSAVLTQFNDEYPEIRFDLNMTDDLEDLVTGRIDFAFRLGKLADNRLRALPLFDTEPVYCAAPNYVKRWGKPKDFANLREHKVGVLSTLNLTKALNTMSGGKANAPLPTEHYHTTNDINTLYELVSGGLCIGSFLNINATKDFSSGRLVHLFPEKRFPGKRLYLVYAKRGVLPVKLGLFKNFVKQNFIGDVSRGHPDILI